jgi:hypothetical protein
MIRYALACREGHDFESWFPSGESYDAQAKRGLVACPACGSTEVEKRLMAPALSRKGGSPKAAVEPDAKPETALPVPSPMGGPPPAAMTLLSEPERAIRAMLKAVRDHVTKTADYVGDTFADEARRMHYGETEHRSIYGESSPSEAKALLEEGIEVHPLPIVADDRN